MTDVVMTVHDIIEAAFGDENENTVNFRLMRLILLIISNQLRILDRHVQINIVRAFKKAAVSSSNFSISEVRVNTRTKKKKKSTNKFKFKQNITAAIAHFSTTSTIGRDKISEEQLEREIRVINQRFDSTDEMYETPTPMGSLETTSSEKILVVGSQGRSPQLVTRDEFDQLLNTVRQIQDQIYPNGEDGLEAEFEKVLRAGTSFTSAMAALQISSRLECFEKKLVRVFTLLTQLAQVMPGINMKSVRDLEQSMYKLQLQSTGLRSQDEFDEDELELHAKSLMESTRSAGFESQDSRTGGQELRIGGQEPHKSRQEPTTGGGTSADEEQFGVTRPMLAVAMGHLRGDVIEHVKTFAETAQYDMMKTKKKLSDMAGKLEAALDFEDRMYQLEASIEHYGGDVATIDGIISSQLTGYQDGITQMTSELETALDTLEQTLSTVTADPEALAELSKKLTSLQYDIANAAHRYKHTDVAQKKLALNLVQLGYEIEKINDSKADRSEVVDALKDKVGIGQLNGMVRQEYYDAVQGDLEKRIIASYHKFNDQELIWQTAINQLVKSINNKADKGAVVLVREDIQRHITAFDERTKVIADILGEPSAAVTNKMVFREKECLSCSLSVPVNMKKVNHSDKLPPLPRSRRTADGAEATELPHGDRSVCYPGMPLPHARDPRADVCQKYCGAQPKLPKVPKTNLGMIVSGMQRFTGTAESDQTSQDTGLKVRKPCISCNKPAADSHPSKVNMVSEPGYVVNSLEVSSVGWMGPRKTSSASLTMRLPSLSD